MEAITIIQAFAYELHELYENVRTEYKYDDEGKPYPSIDVFFSLERDGFPVWRHALQVRGVGDRLEAIPGPLFKRNWQWGETRKFELADPNSIQELVELVEACGDGRPKVKPVQKAPASPDVFREECGGQLSSESR